MGTSGDRRNTTCPRCGRQHSEPKLILCRECREALMAETSTEESNLRLNVSPILRDALASRQSGEDFDEALLRALKARHPERASSLFSAVTRILDLEADRSNERKEQVARRLAASDPGPEISLRTSRAHMPTTVSRTAQNNTVVRVGDEEYHSLDNAPPQVRRAVEHHMSTEKAGPRVGCSWALLGSFLSLIRRL